MSVEITFIGHACFQIASGEVTILTDPFLSPNNPAATRTASDFNPDVIAMTHGHADHVADTLEVAKRSGAQLVGIVEVVNWFSEQGVERVIDLNFGGTAKFDWGSIRLVPAWHTTTLPDGTSGGTAGGLVIEIGGKVIYQLGDTGLFSDLALIKRRSPVDVALVPIGGHYTMDPDDAAEAVRLVEPKTVIPCHYNTFPVVEQDPQVFADLVSQRTSSKTVILKPDETHSI